MTEYVIITANGDPQTGGAEFFLTADIPTYLDALVNKQADVFRLCWSDDREDAHAFTEQEVQEVLHSVESVLMVPDPYMRWEVK